MFVSTSDDIYHIELVDREKYLGKSTLAFKGIFRPDANFFDVGEPSQDWSVIFKCPISKGSKCLECGKVHRVQEKVLPCYERWLLRELDQDEELRGQAADLAAHLRYHRRIIFGVEGEPSTSHAVILAHTLTSAMEMVQKAAIRRDREWHSRRQRAQLVYP